ncbi:MAG: reverse transcriptase-like protein, partial [Nitrospirae bacterium]|nr:reverse transcriptase-like protein [Nitrospirota bacterium]
MALKGQNLIIYTDGVSRGNPGDAGIGVVFKDSKGAVIDEIGKYIGTTTNNVAEYTALINALEYAV